MIVRTVHDETDELHNTIIVTRIHYHEIHAMNATEYTV